MAIAGLCHTKHNMSLNQWSYIPGAFEVIIRNLFINAPVAVLWLYVQATLMLVVFTTE